MFVEQSHYVALEQSQAFMDTQDGSLDGSQNVVHFQKMVISLLGHQVIAMSNWKHAVHLVFMKLVI